MADLTGERDRGQLLLVAAFALGVIFIALAVVVNTAIFTENLATRSEATDGDDALQYRHEVQQSVGAIIGEVNDHDDNSGSPDLAGRATENVSEMQLQSGRFTAASGRVLSVTYLDSEQVGGTRFESSPDAWNFTRGDGEKTWEPATGVKNTRALRINITDDTNLSTTTFGAFNLTVDGGSNEWKMTVYKDTSPTPATVNVTVRANGNTAECGTTTSNPVIDVTGGTLAGEPCLALRVSDGTEMWYGSGVSGQYDIEFENSTEITGTYEGIVGDDSATVNNLRGKTYHAIYSGTVEFTYETAAVRYQTDVRVAPEEPPA